MVTDPRNHGEPWMEKDDKFLAQCFNYGLDVDDIAALFERTRLSIEYRLERLGLRLSPPYQRFSGDGKLYHGHEHTHEKGYDGPLTHEHPHRVNHHDEVVIDKGIAKSLRFATMYGAGERVKDLVEHESKVKPFCCEFSFCGHQPPHRERRNQPTKRHHLHQHAHDGRLREYEDHKHSHSAGHHPGERNANGAIVTSKYTGPLASQGVMEETKYRHRTSNEEFSIQYEGQPPIQGQFSIHRDYSGRVKGTSHDQFYDDKVMRRFVVYYTDSFSARTREQGPIHLVGRRAPRPDMVIETALGMLKRKVNDLRDSSIEVFLVDAGSDKGYGQMVDVKMHRINVHVRVGSKMIWSLTPFTTGD